MIGAHRRTSEDEPAVTDDDLLARIYPKLRRFAAVVAPLDLDPDDLLQDAIAQTLRGGPLSRLDHPLAYLRQAMVHLAANHNRTRGRERGAHARLRGSVATTAPADYPSDLAELERIGPQDRAVLYLADVERLTLDEVADLLGIRPATARARASRARRRLRAALTDEGAHR